MRCIFEVQRGCIGPHLECLDGRPNLQRHVLRHPFVDVERDSPLYISLESLRANLEIVNALL